MKVISFCEARDHLENVLEQVVAGEDCTIISRRDADDAVLMPLAYYNSLMETIYSLKSPANAAHLAKSIAQYRKRRQRNIDYWRIEILTQVKAVPSDLPHQ